MPIPISSTEPAPPVAGGPDLSWYDTLKRYAPAAAGLAAAALLGKPALRSLAYKVAPESAAVMDASRLPFALRAGARISEQGSMAPTRLSRAEVEQFAAHPASQGFLRDDPAIAVSTFKTAPASLQEALTRTPSTGTHAQLRPFEAPMGQVLGHEMEHGEAVARAAAVSPKGLTRNTYYKFTDYEPLTQGPEAARLTRQMTTEYPDLYGMYWTYRRQGNSSPAGALSEVITEYINRDRLLKIPGVTRQHLMTYPTREAILADYPNRAGRIFAELDDIMGGMKPALPRRHPGEANLPVVMPADATRMWEMLQAVRQGRPMPLQRPVDYSQFESRDLKRPRR